MQILPEMYL